MPKYDVTLNLPGFTIKKSRGYDPIIHELKYHRVCRCVSCSSKDLRFKESFKRLIQHESIGHRRVYLEIEVRKYHCRACGRYFRERYPGILPWQRSTESLQKQVYYDHKQGISRKNLSENFHCSDSTISRYYDRVFDLEDRKRLSINCPRILGIDEHFFSRKQGYATTFCDLRKHRVFDVVLGKSGSDLREYLEQLKGREKVKVVCMDMSESYRSIVRKYFPNAKIVADRFHVVRLALHHLIKACKEVDPTLPERRSIISLLRTHGKNLTDKQKVKLDAYLKNNQAVAAIYEFKEKLMILLSHKQQSKKQCKRHINNFLTSVNMLKAVGFESCRKLARSMMRWSEEIVRMWRFSKTNGITEGFHRKMKLIQRRAFGFRNFENYRKRVRVVCM